MLLADEGVAPLPTAGPVKEDKLLLGEGLCPLLPVQSIKEEDIQGEEMPHLGRPIKVESPPLEEWPSPCPSVKEELSQSWEDSSHSPTPRPKKSRVPRLRALHQLAHCFLPHRVLSRPCGDGPARVLARSQSTKLCPLR